MPMPKQVRSGHPYFMYEEIHAQPEAIRQAIEHGREADQAIVGKLRDARRVAVLGNGTSFHAAQVGAGILQTALPAKEVRAVQAFEYVTYHRNEKREDLVIVVSHSGETTMSIASLQHLAGTPTYTIAVTGFPESTVGKTASTVLTTGYGAELSWAHTVSYTAAIALFGGLAVAAGDPHAMRETSEALMELPEQTREVIRLEPPVRDRAADVNGARSVWFVGPSFNQFTAAEAALKMIETNYATSMALEIEQLLHGYFPAIDERDLIWLIAPGAASAVRAADAVKAANIIGIPIYGQVDRSSQGVLPPGEALVLPTTIEALSPILHVIPAQLLSYWITVERGLNPDLIGRGRPKYMAAADSYE